MPPLSFEERATSGRYDELAVTFDEKPDSLATVDYGTHFTAESAAWRDGDIKNYRTTFVPKDNSLGENTSEELVVNIIGEVAREGSELSARANSWMKRGKILEKNSVRDVLVLTLPTMATPALAVLYENQICTLEALEESAVLPVPKAGTKITRCARPTDSGGSTIVVTFPHKYRTPDDDYHVVRPKLKRSLKTAMSDGDTTRPAPQLWGLYEPRFLPDFDPSFFDLRRALLAQQQVCNTTGELVAPWDAQSALRPGTLVAVEATLIVYSFCSEKPATVFQVQCRGVQVLDESPLPIEQVVVTRPPPTPSQARSPSKLFSLLSTPPCQRIIAQNSDQDMGPSTGSNPASTSAATTTPRETTTNKYSAKRTAKK